MQKFISLLHNSLEGSGCVGGGTPLGHAGTQNHSIYFPAFPEGLVLDCIVTVGFTQTTQRVQAPNHRQHKGWGYTEKSFPISLSFTFHSL